MKKNAVLLEERACGTSPDWPLQECSEWWEHGDHRVHKKHEEWQEQILLGAKMVSFVTLVRKFCFIFQIPGD